MIHFTSHKKNMIRAAVATWVKNGRFSNLVEGIIRIMDPEDLVSEAWLAEYAAKWAEDNGWMRPSCRCESDYEGLVREQEEARWQK